MADSRRPRVIIASAVVVVLGVGAAILGPVLWRRWREPPPVAWSTLGIDAIGPSGITRPDGTRLSVALPPVRTAGVTAGFPERGPGARVAGGWVLPVRRSAGGVMPDGSAVPSGGPVPDDRDDRDPGAHGRDGGSELWFLADGAVNPRFVAHFGGSWAVSPDGTVLVLTGVVLDGSLVRTAVAAYRLPSLNVLKGPENTELTTVGGSPVVVGVAGNSAVLQGDGPYGPALGVWPLGAGRLRVRPYAYALGTSRDGRVLVVDVRDRDFVPPADGHDVPLGRRPCLNLVTLAVVLSAEPVGGVCRETVGYEPDASISPDGAWILLSHLFATYTTNDDEDDQDHGLVRTADLAAGRWAPVRQQPFAERAAVASMPLVWASDTTFVVERLRYTLFDQFDPFKSSRSGAGFSLCAVDNGLCRPIDLPKDSTAPMGRYRA